MKGIKGVLPLDRFFYFSERHRKERAEEEAGTIV
jgi:hypothetical protein